MTDTKKCPGCGQALIEGRTYTQLQIRPVWLPKERDWLVISKEYKNTESLKEPVFLTPYSLKTRIHPAWYCPRCDLFLMACKTTLDEDLHVTPKS